MNDMDNPRKSGMMMNVVKIRMFGNKKRRGASV
jgi:hypothetical protein